MPSTIRATTSRSAATCAGTRGAADDSDDLASDALRLGADDHLVKEHTTPSDIRRALRHSDTLQLNITNLFDQDFVTTLFTSPWRDALVIPGDNCTLCAAPFFAGFDTRAVMAARNAAAPNTGRPDPRYNLPNGYRGERVARLFLKYVF